MACSRKKSTWLSRNYHNTTAHYNGYFNARELMKQREAQLRSSYKEDYSQLLPVFIYPNETESQAMYPDMDKVIEKCSEVIERHSIYLRKKENVKWIDDSYFLIGKARLYKNEFGLAEQTFLYVYQAYKKDPARYRGLNWLIKTFIETEQFDKAEEFLDIGEEAKKKFPDEYLGHFNAIYADYHIKKDMDVEQAIEKLENAVKFTKEKELKRRYTFILAQLYQKQNNFGLATDRYSRVLKMNPNYVMRFNARINRAIAYDVSSNNSKDIKKELRKMLRDSKNEEFKDQIYFALAELALKEDDEPLAIDYLRKSTRFSVNNDKQKALSYLKLADIYFEQPHYINAQAHYDSTLLYLPEEHPEYYDAEAKNNSLQDLVKNLKVIQMQDSLLALSNMSEKDRKKKVKEIIKNLKEEEERKQQEEFRKLQALQAGNNSNIINTAGNSGKKGEWYFYNTTTLALGVSEFKSIWGDRQLEDNWRRKLKSSRTIQNQGGEENPDGAETLSDSALVAKENEKYDPEFYLKDIPKDKKEQLIAHGKVAEALFNVGTIFKESFTDYNSAINSFERVTVDYDTSKFNLPSHYQLYRIYKINEYEEKAEIEKKWVLDNHPFSEYAYLIKNPNYNKETKATKEKVEEFYAATYRLFKYGLYDDVIASCNKADQTFTKNHIKAKFDFLKAKAIGHTRSKEEFKAALNAVIADHPNDPVKDNAQQILNYMEKAAIEASKPPPAPEKDKLVKEQQKVAYEYDAEDKHIFILSAEKEAKNFNRLKNQLANFNRQYFRQDQLNVTASALGEKDLYLVRTFETQAQAMRYLKALRNNNALKSVIQGAKAKDYIISNGNFRSLFKSKDEGQYLEFFNQNYPL